MPASRKPAAVSLGGQNQHRADAGYLEIAFDPRSGVELTLLHSEICGKCCDLTQEV